MLRWGLRAAGQASLRTPAKLQAFPLSAQMRCLETETTEIMNFKKNEFFVYEGVLHKVISRNTYAVGRGAATGKMLCTPVTGHKRGQTLELTAMKYEKADLKRAKLMFDHVDEEKDVLVMQEYKVTPSLDVEATGNFYELTGEKFEEVITDGAGTLKWLRPEMTLSSLIADEDIVEMKMPQTWQYTAEAVSQVGGKWMALIEENDQQIVIDSPHGKAGDLVTLSLPKARFLRLN